MARDLAFNSAFSYGTYRQRIEWGSTGQYYLTKFRDNRVNGISFSEGVNGDNTNTLLFNVYGAQGLKIMDDGNLESEWDQWTKLDSSGTSAWNLESITFC